MELVTGHVRDLAVLRWMLFATAFLPKELPYYWEIVISFAHEGTSTSCTAEGVEVMMGNLQMLNEKAFASDDSLLQELIHMKPNENSKTIGLVLISLKVKCMSCEEKLSLRAD